MFHLRQYVPLNVDNANSVQINYNAGSMNLVHIKMDFKTAEVKYKKIDIF